MISTAPTRRPWTPPMSNTAPLSKKQKGIICSMARRAFLSMRAGGALAPETVEEVWRREQQEKAAGCYHLTAAIQDDYKPLLSHFNNLLGNVRVAMRQQMEAALEPVKIARNALRKTCADRGIPLHYAERICRQAWKCSISEANERQVWWVRKLVLKMRTAVASNIPF